MNTLEIQRGNPLSANMTFSYSDGTPINITDMTILFALKKPNDKLDDDSAALITQDVVTHSNASGGMTTLILTAEQTLVAVGDYKYDLRLYKDGAVQGNTLTYPAAVVNIVTKRTP
jgi:hypothetical protein